MKTHQERLAEHLEHARDQYDEEMVRGLQAAARTVDERLASMPVAEAQSYGDLNDMLGSAVSEKFCAGPDDYAWVVDFDDTSVVFSMDGAKQQASYSVDGTTVTFGDPVPVREQTTYVPVEVKFSSLVGELRNDPTTEDYHVAYGLKNAKKHLEGVKADQQADPDHGTDPDDIEVSKHIDAAGASLDKAIAAQAKDAASEDGRSASPARSWATAKRAFSSLLEQPPAHVAEVQVRLDAGEDPNIGHFVGYASTTGVPYSVRDWLGEYDETILPGAFAKTLREQTDVPLLFNHDGIPLASTASGTSRLSEDSVGLRNEAELDRRDALSNSVCVQLSRNVLGKMSFSFRAVKDTWNDAYDSRGVSEAALYDSSIVTYPANPTTSGELVDAMRSALGREGRSLWLAEHELSVRSALPGAAERGMLEDGADELLDRALRALAHADEVVSRSNGPHGRARTFLVAQAMVEMRAGKVLSGANQKLLSGALDALGSAEKHHAKAAAAHQKASDALETIAASGEQGEGQGTGSSKGSVSKKSGNGTSNGTPPGNGNPIAPGDGAGPRGQIPEAVLQARRQVERLKRGGR
jgi:HK97 family phage prohead protease